MTVVQHITIHSLDPLRDPRWPEFVRRHPNASVFHTPGWLRALQRTYHYEPVAFTTSAPTEKLRSALLFCAVRSWLTGNRLVCLPFSDHCEPLVESTEELNELRLYVQSIGKQQRWKYVEMRSANSALQLDGVFQRSRTFYLHRLDLRPDPDALLRSFHKNSVQTMIRRAEREGLAYEAGRSESLLAKLYGLLLCTRWRHHIPPQPMAWFRNLVDCLDEDACIRIASKHGQPVAAILTLSHGKRVVYKYGGSDARLNSFGGMALLFWKTIQEAKQAGAEEFDLGRSDCDNLGLITFKERWAADRSTLTYWRWPAGAMPAFTDGWMIRFAKHIFARLPDRALTLAGKLLYRHIGSLLFPSAWCSLV
jgi:CelD/BcsL family acetyltransferase involved in cellulose biosynthesis